MRESLSGRLRLVAQSLFAREGQKGDSPYLNIPYYQKRVDPVEPSGAVSLGPPSMYDEPGERNRMKRRDKDVRRQGPRPGPVDLLLRAQPIQVTMFGNPKEDVQGEVDDNVKTKGRRGPDEAWIDEDDSNRDTIGFNPGELSVNPFD